MSVPFWPSDLPQRVLRDGYQQSLPDGRLRQKMDAGPGKVRRRSSAAVRPVSGEVVVDINGRARLERFWEEEIGGGTLPFWLPSQWLDGVGLATADGDDLLTSADESILVTAWWLVRFGDAPPAFTSFALDLFTATLELEILP